MHFVRFRVDLAPRCSLGPGKIALLEAITSKGSLTQAAASLGMSYRYAWLLLEDLNQSFKEPLTTATVGGTGGGGVALTEFGLDVVRRYRAAQKRIESLAQDEFASILRKAVGREPMRAGSAADAPKRRTRSIKRSASRAGS